jgi:hypothetical protein
VSKEKSIERVNYGGPYLENIVSGTPEAMEAFDIALDSYINDKDKKQLFYELLIRYVDVKWVSLDSVNEYSDLLATKITYDKRRRAIYLDDKFDLFPRVEERPIIEKQPKALFDLFFNAYSSARGFAGSLNDNNPHITSWRLIAINDGRCPEVCLNDHDRIFIKPEHPKLPHFLGCACTLSPLINLLSDHRMLIEKELERRKKS